MVERDGDDGRVDDLEEGGNHHGERYDPFVHVVHDKPIPDKTLLLCKNRRDNGETHPQEVAGVLTRIQRDLYGYPLDHLDEITRRVLGGKRENAEPVPAMMLSTRPLNVLPGYVSTSITTFWPGLTLSNWVSL